MTATIGIGKTETLPEAKKYILEMCAKFSLLSPPSQSEEIMSLIHHPTEGNISAYQTCSRKYNIIGSYTHSA